jgi:FMN-dependent oxidoreductase (nitrilotriacetate monooxygenase family)
MTQQRQLHLNAFVMGVGHHESAWRLPESDAFSQVDLAHFVKVTQIAEAGKLDSIFFADGPALFGNPRYRPVAALDPLPLLAALATHTSKIGLIATASTTYKEPYDLARAFATIDHISNGRAGWNIVTTAFPDAARNFGREEQPTHAERYARAEEFVQVATKLWDSWQDDAVIGDKSAGVFAEEERIRAIDHVGERFKVAGPLNVPRSPQGYPVLVQAGSSESGRDFAGRWAEAIFVAVRTLVEAQEFQSDIKARAVAAGRRSHDVVVLPGVVPFLGSTEEEAAARHQQFTDQIIPAYGLRQLSTFFGVDLTGAELDGPLPEVPHEEEIEGHKSRSSLIAELAQREKLTVRQLIVKLGGGRGHREFTGTPEQLADDMELWFASGGADGFNVMAPGIPADLETFIEQVVPILQKRGLFREEYSGETLRDHYGLQRPANRISSERALAGVAS